MQAADKNLSSRIWIYRGDGAHAPTTSLILRSAAARDGPAQFLAGYKRGTAGRCLRPAMRGSVWKGYHPGGLLEATRAASWSIAGDFSRHRRCGPGTRRAAVCRGTQADEQKLGDDRLPCGRSTACRHWRSCKRSRSPGRTVAAKHPLAQARGTFRTSGTVDRLHQGRNDPDSQQPGRTANETDRSRAKIS